ncbi:hypothetical protein C8Q77DRAFT_914764 [Trametes polyzona]|nr:hypothetical protein C8Q77DRAFT_914764 [Trametes polyzona]
MAPQRLSRKHDNRNSRMSGVTRGGYGQMTFDTTNLFPLRLAHLKYTGEGLPDLFPGRPSTRVNVLADSDRTRVHGPVGWTPTQGARSPLCQRRSSMVELLSFPYRITAMKRQPTPLIHCTSRCRRQTLRWSTLRESV